MPSRLEWGRKIEEWHGLPWKVSRCAKQRQLKELADLWSRSVVEALRWSKVAHSNNNDHRMADDEIDTGTHTVQ